MEARFATVTEEEIRQMNEEAAPANTKSTCLVNTKTTIPLSDSAYFHKRSRNASTVNKRTRRCIFLLKNKFAN